jgi:hypothetical protein
LGPSDLLPLKAADAENHLFIALAQSPSNSRIFSVLVKFENRKTFVRIELLEGNAPLTVQGLSEMLRGE